MYVGTQGVGFVIFNPQGALVSDSEREPIRTTTAEYAGNMDTAFNQFDATAQSNSIYSYASMVGGGAQARLVGAGIRIAYTGTTLNQSGTLLTMYRPGNQDLDPVTPNDVLQYAQSNVSAVTRQTKFVTYRPDSTALISYQATEQLVHNAATSTFGSWAYGFTVFGAVPGTSFLVETISHFEVIGHNFPVTKSHADPLGYAAVSEAVEASQPTTQSSSYQYFVNTLEKVTKSLGEIAYSTAQNAANAAVMTGVAYARQRYSPRIEL